MLYAVSHLVLYSTARIRYFYLKFMDRVYQQVLLKQLGKYGENVHIYFPCQIFSPQFMEVGNNVHINRGAFIKADGGLKIGNNVHIARNLTIYTVNHNYMGHALPYDHTVIKKRVIIGDNVWIGINVTIVPGVTIGEGAVIGAGVTVARDVPPLAIVGTAPQRIIKFRDKEHYNHLKAAHQYGGVNGYLIETS